MKNNSIKILLFFLAIIAVGYFYLVSSLPNEATIKKYRPETTVTHFNGFDWTRDAVAPVRKYVPLSQISPELRSAVIISEDDAFFHHAGINMTEMKKAFQENMQKKRYARGASTITMQLARNAFLHKKKTVTRKVKEIILTQRIEKVWTKQRILEYYLNIVEWGRNVYGAEAAARYYFDKPAASLNLAESTLLAAILPNPIELDLFKNFSGARKRQARILRLMHNSRMLSEDEMKAVLNTPVYVRGTRPKSEIREQPQISIFESALTDPRIPQNLKQQADSTGILFLPETDKNNE
ncbi:MAG: monofunctional biosynthetic peptidoglycan transglycosylase [Candidatus Zhuqueibacterota bacterium]